MVFICERAAVKQKRSRYNNKVYKKVWLVQKNYCEILKLILKFQILINECRYTCIFVYHYSDVSFLHTYLLKEIMSGTKFNSNRNNYQGTIFSKILKEMSFLNTPFNEVFIFFFKINYFFAVVFLDDSKVHLIELYTYFCDPVYVNLFFFN